MKILVVSYSQSGQLTEIINSFLGPLAKSDQVEIDFHQIRLKHDFPFPWSYLSFFDVQPESVLEVAAGLEPMEMNLDTKYDLVLLGYQTWFLSPSIPITSFLQSPEAAKLLQDTPVITMNGCRNMWIQGQVSVKKRVQDLGGKLIWGITLYDRSPNWLSVITIPLWMLSGKQQFFSKLPKAGVSEEEIQGLNQYGEVLLEAMNSGQLDQNFSESYPTQMQPNLILLEQNAKRIFRKWAALIRFFGGPRSWTRKPILVLFSVYLITIICIMFPVNLLVFRIYKTFFKKKLQNKIDSYSKNLF